jgi:hypothetical protein
MSLQDGSISADWSFKGGYCHKPNDMQLLIKIYRTV